MPKLFSLPITVFLLLILLSGCTRNSTPSIVTSPTTAHTPTMTSPQVDGYPAYPLPDNEIPTAVGYLYPEPATTPAAYPHPELARTPTNYKTVFPAKAPTRTPAPTLTPTLFKLAQPFPAPLYFINLAQESIPQVWRLERDGSMVTQITHEKEGVTALDVAGDGRLAYLSNNALIVTDARGGQRKVLAQGDPLPFTMTDDELDEKFIKLTTPVWSPDGKLIAFYMGETWLADPENGELIQVTEDRSEEQLLYGRSFVPQGWTPDGMKIILKILPPLYGHGGEGLPSGLGFVEPRANAIPISPGGLGCNDTCEFSLLKNGQVLLGGRNGTGLWMVDPKTGQRKNLLPEQDPKTPPNYPTLRWPKQTPNNRILFFKAGGSEATPLLFLAYANEKPIPIPYPKGVTTIGQTDILWMNEALWSADAQMVLWGSGGLWRGQADNIYQINALDGTVTKLNVKGYNVRWGK